LIIGPGHDKNNIKKNIIIMVLISHIFNFLSSKKYLKSKYFRLFITRGGAKCILLGRPKLI
jgi:hypothetical protein